MLAKEMVFHAVLGKSLNSTGCDKTEKDFLSALCFHLGIKTVDEDTIDSMKEAVLNFILNQVEDWVKIENKDNLEGNLLSNLKKLGDALEHLKYRQGTRQIYWEQVLKNHRKLIKAYFHILTISRTDFG